MDYDYGLYDNDLVDGDSYYYGSEEEDENEIPALTLQQTYHMCLKPTLYDSVTTVSHVFIWCFVFRLSKLFFANSGPIPHLISILCGCLSLHSLFSTSLYYIIFLVLITYALLFLLSYFQLAINRGVLLILSSLFYLCICELWLVDSKKWHQIRGPQMLVVMKSVSLAFDLDIGTVKKIPNLIYYLGYLLCPSSSVFGPWVSFNDYLYNYAEKWNLQLVKKILINLVLAVLFLTISTCWSEYLIPSGSWKWFAAYRDALSFRTSHYFICYLSELTLLFSGCSNGDSKTVTKPHKVEFPRSIVNVVIYWNIPMHNWLKVYIFNTSRKFGNFFAILSTYTVSSLLHGINFQLSAVLLSLGVYSYVEVMLRKKLAGGFGACILAKECKPDCNHKHKKYHPFVLLTNVFLVLLTIFHLAYLGVVFESASLEEEEIGYTWRHTINKWASLNYLSPYIALLTYVMYSSSKVDTLMNNPGRVIIRSTIKGKDGQGQLCREKFIIVPSVVFLMNRFLTKFSNYKSRDSQGLKPLYYHSQFPNSYSSTYSILKEHHRKVRLTSDCSNQRGSLLKPSCIFKKVTKMRQKENSRKS